MALIDHVKPQQSSAPIDQSTLEEIQELKRIIGVEATNAATRRYHALLAKWAEVGFQMDKRNDAWYHSLFFECLLEQKQSNPKGF